MAYLNEHFTDKEMVVNKPHKHAEIIKAWADGIPVQFLNYTWNPPRWQDVSEDGTIAWRNDLRFRIKPLKEYPKSNLPYQKMCDAVNEAAAYQRETGSNEGYQTIIARFAADKAVAHFIEHDMVKYFIDPANGYITVEN